VPLCLSFDSELIGEETSQFGVVFDFWGFLDSIGVILNGSGFLYTRRDNP
jgi:hypothetical protein